MAWRRWILSQPFIEHGLMLRSANSSYRSLHIIIIRFLLGAANYLRGKLFLAIHQIESETDDFRYVAAVLCVYHTHDRHHRMPYKHTVVELPLIKGNTFLTFRCKLPLSIHFPPFARLLRRDDGTKNQYQTCRRHWPRRTQTQKLADINFIEYS